MRIKKRKIFWIKLTSILSTVLYLPTLKSPKESTKPSLAFPRRFKSEKSSTISSFGQYLI